MIIRKTARLLAAAALVTSIFCGSAEACTGVYVGKGVSTDGSVMIARTEDIVSDESKRFIVHPAADHEPGTYYKDAYGLEIEYPAHTYRYTAVPGSASRNIGKTPYGEAGFNELGVAATSTITAYPNEKAEAADPFVETGLHELSVNDIILSRARTAREGIQIIAAIVDEYGSGEGNIIMTADKNEAWYMEIYTGHQYAAIRLPDDKAAVIPNAYMLNEVDLSSRDVIASADLEKLPRENGFRQPKTGIMNLRDTYAEEKKDQNSIRIWGGSRILNRVMWEDPYKSEYELLFKPTAKISVKDVMNVCRSRYEGTGYSLDEPGNKYIRAIGTSRQEECHVLQIRPTMDIKSGCIEWLCLGNAEFAPFVPYYAAAITDIPYMYGIDAPGYDESSAFWNSRGLSTLCAMNRGLYGNSIKSFFSSYEDDLIKNIAASDKIMLAAADKTAAANKLCYDYAYDSFNKQREMYRKLMRFLAKYEGEDEDRNNTYKFEIDMKPEMDDFVGHVTSLPAVITE